MHGATKGGGQPKWAEVRRLKRIEDAAKELLKHPYSKKATDKLVDALKENENV